MAGECKSPGIPVGASVMKTKALYFAKEFGFTSFNASDGWMDR